MFLSLYFFTTHGVQHSVYVTKCVRVSLLIVSLQLCSTAYCILMNKDSDDKYGGQITSWLFIASVSQVKRVEDLCCHFTCKVIICKTIEIKYESSEIKI